jgi:threonine/homoserine/homoserine lactone efflux protein
LFLFIGLFIGFIAAIPLGPVNVFIISQTMKRDFQHGFMAGITACVLDSIYCLVAILGLSQVTAVMDRWVIVLKIGASVFLIAIAWRTFYQSKALPESKSDKVEAKFSPRPLIAVVLMYISNPSLYAFWLGVGGMVTTHNWVRDTGFRPFLFSIACGFGGVIWYFVLTHYVSKHHHQFSPRTFQRIFLALAVILFAFGAYTFASIFVDFKIHL